MTTYKSLYHLMVRSMSEAIDLYDEGKGILAREVLKKALLDAEEQVITHDIILLSAAALPVSWQCSLISVYRGTHQCGECSNAAFGTQSAAVPPSHAPHGVRRV